jgi:hypothetical protein
MGLRKELMEGVPQRAREKGGERENGRPTECQITKPYSSVAHFDNANDENVGVFYAVLISHDDYSKEEEILLHPHY